MPRCRWAGSESPPTSPTRPLFLASDLASWITGQTLIVDGGAMLGLGGAPPVPDLSHGAPRRQRRAAADRDRRSRAAHGVARAGVRVTWSAAPLDPPRAWPCAPAWPSSSSEGSPWGDDDPDTTGDTPAEERDNSAKLPLKSSTTTEPRTTTTRPPTTTTTIPVGPVFGEPVGAGLIVYSSAAWQLVDLDTGARTDLDLPVRGSFGELAVRGGLVMINQDGSREAELYPISRSGEVGPPVVLGLADQVLPAGRPDRVWLIDGGGRSNGGGGFANSTVDVRLVDLAGESLRSFRGRERLRVARRWTKASCSTEADGSTWPTRRASGPSPSGWTVGVMGDDLLLISCDDDAVCALTRQPVDGGAATALIDRVDVDRIGFDAITADDGRIALMSYGEDGAEPAPVRRRRKVTGSARGRGDRLQRDAEVAARRSRAVVRRRLDRPVDPFGATASGSSEPVPGLQGISVGGRARHQLVSARRRTLPLDVRGMASTSSTAAGAA